MTDPRTHPMVERLVAVHDGMRAELARLRNASADLSSDPGRPPMSARTLRLYCLRLCGVVRGHHEVEETAIFPALRRSRAAADPRLAAVIDRLEDEHRTLMGYLDEVDRTFAALPQADATARRVAADSLAKLGDHLLKHFAYEEENLASALAQLEFSDL